MPNLNTFPEDYTDIEYVSQLYKAKSGYYTRIKGVEDGEKGIYNPPTKEGYYYDEYIRNYNLALSGLPF